MIWLCLQAVTMTWLEHVNPKGWISGFILGLTAFLKVVNMVQGQSRRINTHQQELELQDSRTVRGKSVSASY